MPHHVVMEYGPPGHKGVTSIMGIGAADIEPTNYGASLMRVGVLAGVLWVAGGIIGSNTLKNIGIGGAGALLAAFFLAKRADKKAAGVP